MKHLPLIDADIDRRVAAIANEFGPWPCRKGCDDCCRRLGDLMPLTAPEWARLRDGLRQLPEAAQRDVHERALAVRQRPNPDETFVCPILDRDAGACRAYEHRPAACRSYGFYVGREGERYCAQVAEHIGERKDEVVWGNQVALDRDLERHGGESRPLDAWLRDDPL